jgi:FMN-binding domain
VSLPAPAKLFAIGLLCLCGPSARAMDTVYLDPAEFLARYLPGCRQQALWLDAQTRTDVERLIEHAFPGVRVRYCSSVGKTAWILDEIGKTEPITSGIIIAQGRVEAVRVLVFRESRGSEVHRNAFTRQYEHAGLDRSDRLDRPIDGITGATLSVHALNRQVKLALYLDGLVREQGR